MELLRNVLSRRSTRVAALLLATGSILCTRVPLLNYLGFEFSFVTAVAGGFVSGLLVLALLRSINPDRLTWNLVGAVTLTPLLLTGIPLVFLLLNAFFVKNCSMGQGLLFFALLVPFSVLFSAALAGLTWALLRRWRKTWFTLL
ncbi:MAG: hypothetical protein WD295_05855, partial [Bacteroidota bacterium]